MPNSRLPAIAALCLGLTVLALGCSSGPSSSNVARVVIEGTDATLVVGDTRSYTAHAEDAAGATVSGAPIVWSSSLSSAATVSTAGEVAALAPGTTRIVARSGSRADTVTITVVTSYVANVIVTISKALLKVSDTVQATARAVDATGATVTGRPVTWTSTNPTAALVTPFGLVLGIAPANPVTITATIDGKVGSATVAVIPAEIGEVIVQPDSALLAPGGTVQMQVQVFDEFGFEVVDPVVTWSSFIQNVATINADGLVTAVSLGESTVRASIGGKIGEALVRVLDVDSEKYRIEVTNYLFYPIEVLENGNSVGRVEGQSTGVVERPLRQSFQFGWAVIQPQGRGEEVSELGPVIQDPTGTYHFDVDNVFEDGRVFYTPLLRNLTPSKPFVDPLPRQGASACGCSLSPELDEVRNLGYWLLNPTSVVRFFAASDPGLTNPLKVVPVPVGEPEERSGIWRYTLVSLP
jgi:uncharacterized protein YjdB